MNISDYPTLINLRHCAKFERLYNNVILEPRVLADLLAQKFVVRINGKVNLTLIGRQKLSELERGSLFCGCKK